jgi:DNA-binding LacI/PurR family transcriptional regulator
MTIGLVAPLFGFWYSAQVVAGAESVLSDSGYDLLVHSVDTPENRRRFLAGMGALRGRVDGLLLVDFFTKPEQALALRDSGTPGVAVGARIEGFSSLTIDNRGAAETAVRHVIELGHRRIGLITDDPIPSNLSPVPGERASGYATALAAAGLPRDSALERAGGLAVAGGAASIEALLATPDPPTAVFCMSDEMAMGAVGRARELGFSVPGDVSVVGFDDHDLAEAFGLTTMHQPVREMGRWATTMLVDAIHGATDAPIHRVADVTLVVRRTTAPPRT